MFHAGLVLALPAAMLSSAASAASCSPPLHPRIAEVFYDAVGDDTGREFVELLNPHGVPLPLAGVRLEAGDGSGPGRWTLRWTGGAADSVAAGARFVVGGTLVDATPKATAALDLQNGPDAVRLVWPDGATEVVGYGALEFPEYSCGDPALDVASGQSLARLPDDADLGSNALDFRAATPSPGRANQRRRDAAVVSGSARVDPELPMPGGAARVLATIENRGLDSVAPADLVLTLREAEGAEPLASATLPTVLAAAESVAVTLDLPALVAGEHRLVTAVALAGDEAPENDADSLWVRVGQGPLQLAEVQFHPQAGEGEWIEVVNAGASFLDLATFALTDRGGHPARLPASPLPPESLAVLAQDRGALLARFPALDSTRVLEPRPWPSLNNSDDESGVADVVRLVEARGTLTDRLAYSAAGIPPGFTLERSGDGVWAPGLVTGGSPLSFPRAATRLPRRFEVEPRRLGLGAEARLKWDLPWPKARVALELYDLAGRPRGVVLEESLVGGRGERAWVPRDLGAGLYLLVMRARPESGDGALAVTRALRLEGR